MDQPLTRRERIAREKAEARRAGQAESAGETYAVRPEDSRQGDRRSSAPAEPAEQAHSPHHKLQGSGPAFSPMQASGDRPFIRPAARDVRRGHGTGPQHNVAPAQSHSAPTGYAAPAAYSPPTGYSPPGGYAAPGAYSPPTGHAAPAGHTPPAAYAAPGAYSPPAAYSPPTGYIEPEPEPRKPEPEPLGFVRGTIRGFGELCITAGLVLILFVVWQLWWTDIEANKDNQHLADSLSEQWRENPLDKLPEDPDTPVPAALPDENKAFGIMYIPRFGPNYYRTIAEGVSLEPVLNRMGMGHYPSTARPGEVGNFAMAGHRVTYGKPLNLIAEMQPGDRIYICLLYTSPSPRD